MSNSFQKKTSSFLVNVIIGLIVIAFVVSGLYSFNGGAPDSIATVGDYSVKLSEYENEVQRQTQFMSNFMNGGKPLSSSQMKQFGVRKNALNNLINSKVMITFADEVGATASKTEIKKQIKDMPYFKTNEQFDVNKYKQLLAYNRITPEDFENDTANQIKLQKVQNLMAQIPVSDTYKKEVATIKSTAVKATIVNINKEDLKKQIKISNKEINEFLNDETNMKRVENLFKERKGALDQKEQVLASHILIDTKDGEAEALKKIQDIAKKTNTKNFKSMAAKFSTEPGAKDRKGSLGWFGRGRMVPEFEKAAFSMKKGEISAPIKTNFGYHLILVEGKKAAVEAKLDNHKMALAKELIQKSKDIKELLVTVKSSVESALKSGNKKTLDRVVSQYDLALSSNVEVNQLDSNRTVSQLSDDEIMALFSKGVINKIYTFDSASKVTLVKSEKMNEKEITKNKDEGSLERILTRVLQQNIVKEQKEKVSVKINGNISFQ